MQSFAALRTRHLFAKLCVGMLLVAILLAGLDIIIVADWQWNNGGFFAILLGFIIGSWLIALTIIGNKSWHRMREERALLPEYRHQLGNAFYQPTAAEMADDVRILVRGGLQPIQSLLYFWSWNGLGLVTYVLFLAELVPAWHFLVVYDVLSTSPISPPPQPLDWVVLAVGGLLGVSLILLGFFRMKWRDVACDITATASGIRISQIWIPWHELRACVELTATDTISRYALVTDRGFVKLNFVQREGLQSPECNPAAFHGGYEAYAAQVSQLLARIVRCTGCPILMFVPSASTAPDLADLSVPLAVEAEMHDAQEDPLSDEIAEGNFDREELVATDDVSASDSIADSTRLSPLSLPIINKITLADALAAPVVPMTEQPAVQPSIHLHRRVALSVRLNLGFTFFCWWLGVPAACSLGLTLVLFDNLPLNLRTPQASAIMLAICIVIVLFFLWLGILTRRIKKPGIVLTARGVSGVGIHSSHESKRLVFRLPWQDLRAWVMILDDHGTETVVYHHLCTAHNTLTWLEPADAALRGWVRGDRVEAFSARSEMVRQLIANQSGLPLHVLYAADLAKPAHQLRFASIPRTWTIVAAPDDPHARAVTAALRLLGERAVLVDQSRQLATSLDEETYCVAMLPAAGQLPAVVRASLGYRCAGYIAVVPQDAILPPFAWRAVLSWQDAPILADQIFEVPFTPNLASGQHDALIPEPQRFPLGRRSHRLQGAIIVSVSEIMLLLLWLRLLLQIRIDMSLGYWIQQFLRSRSG